MDGENPTSNHDETTLELSCWVAACQALATVAPRYGLGPAEVRQICEECSEIKEGDDLVKQGSEAVLIIQRIVIGLIENISQNGASRDMLLDAAQDAFEARRKLTLLDLPSQITDWT